MQPSPCTSPVPLLLSSQQAQQDYINSYLRRFEAALFGPAPADPASGWRTLANQSSAVDYFLFNVRIHKIMSNERLNDVINTPLPASPWPLKTVFLTLDHSIALPLFLHLGGRGREGALATITETLAPPAHPPTHPCRSSSSLRTMGTAGRSDCTRTPRARSTLGRPGTSTVCVVVCVCVRARGEGGGGVVALLMCKTMQHVVVAARGHAGNGTGGAGSCQPNPPPCSHRAPTPPPPPPQTALASAVASLWRGTRTAGRATAAAAAALSRQRWGPSGSIT